jgi:hypothetical protein
MLAFALSGSAAFSGSAALAQGAVSGPCLAAGSLDTTPPTSGALVIQQICVSGQRVASATIGVGVGDAQPKGTAVTTGQAFTSPATFSTPAGITLDVITSNGNQQRLAAGTTIVQNVGKFGEFFSMAVGHATAFVRHALSFYNFQSLKVVGAARGTVFDVDAKPNVSVTFSISEGKLTLSRLVTIRLIAEKQTIEGIRQTDTITPGGSSSITYTVPFGIFKDFTNAAEARQYFQSQLDAAQAAGDEMQIENSLLNIERVGGVAPPVAYNPAVHVAPAAHGLAGLSTVELGAVALGVAGIATGIAVGTSSSSDHSGGSPGTTVPGTITLSSRTHAHASAHFTLRIPLRF